MEGLFLESKVIKTSLPLLKRDAATEMMRGKNDGRRIYCSVMTTNSEAAAMPPGIFML